MTFFKSEPSSRSEGLTKTWNQVCIPKHRKTALQQVAGGLVSVRWQEEPAFLQTSELESKAKRSILLPSEQRMFFLTVWESFRSLFHRHLLLWRRFCVLTQLSLGEYWLTFWNYLLSARLLCKIWPCGLVSLTFGIICVLPHICVLN